MPTSHAEVAREIAKTMRVEWAHTVEESDHLYDLIWEALRTAAAEARAGALDEAYFAVRDLFLLVPPERQHLIRAASRPVIKAAVNADALAKGDGDE